MSSLSDNFQSALVVHLKTKKITETHLDFTSDLLLYENPCAVYSGKAIVEYSKDKLSLYRLKPYSKIRDIICKDTVTHLLFIDKYFLYLSDTLLCVSNGESSRRIQGDYKDCLLLNISPYLGIQSPSSLCLYDLDSLLEGDTTPLWECKSNISSFTDNVLITSLGFTLTIFITKEDTPTSYFLQKGTIVLPSLPTCLCTDLLFTKIYCGTDKGSILCISLDGSTNTSLDYHKHRIVSLCFSLCNKFLYSSDSQGVLCVWDVEHSVVVDRVEFGCEAYSLLPVLVGSMDKDVCPI